MEEKTIFFWCFSWKFMRNLIKFRISSHHLHIESGRYIRVHLRSQGYVRSAARGKLRKTYFVGPRWKALKTIALHTKKNFRLRDKNHVPFKLNGQSRTAFGLLKAPELQRLSVTVEVLRVGVISVGVMTVGVMTLSHWYLLLLR